MLQSNSSQVLATFTVAWVVWRVSKHLLVRSPLDRVPGLKPPSWLGGSLMQMFDQNGWDFHDNIADKYQGILRFHGFFGARSLYVYDPTALNHITLKDQHLYEPADDMLLTNSIIFGKGLISTTGSHHRKQRKMLNPAFAPSQMREITPIFYDVGQELCDSISRQIIKSQGKRTINMLEWLTRASLEFVAQGFLGSSFDALKGRESGDHTYWTSVKNLPRILTFPEFIFPRFFILPYASSLGSPAFRRWIIDMLPWKSLHLLRDTVNVMHQTSIAIFETRKQSIISGEEESTTRPGRGKDIMSILLRANLSASEDDRLPDDELLAQISTITFAAMDTTSNSLARILHLLCEHQDVQERLRQEFIDAQAHHLEDIPYDDLMALPYLDAVCKETHRVFTAVPLVVKQTKVDTVLPLSTPLTSTDGEPMTEVLVPQGTFLVLSLNACNRDPGIWGADAREWKPERWLNPLPKTVFSNKIPGVYSHLMTFYGGTRACIGFKFAELEMKAVLCMLLQRFCFNLSDKKIIWKMNGVNQPMMEDSDLDEHGLPLLQLPLTVTPLSKS